MIKQHKQQHIFCKLLHTFCNNRELKVFHIQKHKHYKGLHKVCKVHHRMMNLLLQILRTRHKCLHSHDRVQYILNGFCHSSWCNKLRNLHIQLSKQGKRQCNFLNFSFYLTPFFIVFFSSAVAQSSDSLLPDLSFYIIHLFPFIIPPPPKRRKSTTTTNVVTRRKLVFVSLECSLRKH